jgi:hypothetical protein
MIEYILLVLIPVIGFIGWLVGYGMGVRDYKENRNFIEGREE